MSLDSNDSEILDQLDKLLNSGNQAWLLGAGTSYDSGVPLMLGLTKRVLSEIKDEGSRKAIDAIRNELSEKCHIEHILSHLADCRAIAERRRDETFVFGQQAFTIEKIDELHKKIVDLISTTVRWGYIAGDGEKQVERIGSYSSPIVKIDNQTRFVKAIFHHRQKNITERRRPIRFFTTNYDTLMEDALALCCVPYWDGFEGGAIAFRTLQFGDSECLDGSQAQVVKLHGSIDWHLDLAGKVWRLRDSDHYPEKTSRVLIYPQATKYLATQRDPFASQFEIFRRFLSSAEENVLAIVGYSFSDEHINQEIQLAMDAPSSKTTVIAFVEKKTQVPNEWISRPWATRLYVICEDGVLVRANEPVAKPEKGNRHDWWKFHQVSKMLESGPGACLS